MNRKQIASGVHVNIYPMEQFKTNQIFVSFIMPLSERVASYASLLSMVLKTGCADYPNVKSLGRALDELYGAKLNVSLRKKGDNHVVTFSLEFLDNSFAHHEEITTHALALMTKILFHPLTDTDAFVASAVEREKKNLCNLIEGRINDKRLYALRRCGELSAKGQPYQCYECGTADCVEQITAKSLFDFYKEYLESSVIEIFGFGRITDEQIENVFGKYFAKNRVPIIEPSRSIEVGELKEYEENYPVDQAKLSIGFAFNQTVNDVAQRLFLILYGGSPSSLLFANVREKLSLCYYCSATLEKHKNLMIVYSGVMPEKIEEARKEILVQLANIVRGEFTQFEFAAAKKTYINNLKAMNDSVSQLEDYALNQTLAGKPVSIESDIMQIEQLTENDIQDVAKTVKPIAVYVLKGGMEQ